MAKEKLHILICDDSDDDRFFFKNALSQVNADARLDVACDGEQLIDWLSSHRGQEPDIIFLDLNMPRKNGFECLQEMKAMYMNGKPVIFVYSTADDRESIDKTYGSGANLYIVKPSDFTKLPQLIEKAFGIISQYDHSRPPRDKFVLSEKSAA